MESKCAIPAKNEPKKKNPKAYTFNSAKKARKQEVRRLDLQTRKHHIPSVDREQEIPPPMVVVVAGPPKCGKSTILHCLVKHYTRQSVSQIQGPVTVVTGKKKRLTMIECNNDINSMVDLGKVADLVLLVINAKQGLQMEVFEFLTILQVHGFPRVIGVLTNLDTIKDNKALKIYKKKLKQRFWTDVYPGAKLFYLTGFKHENYGKREVINLARFISLARPPQLSWRVNHPYILCDRSILLYGYIHGTYMKPQNRIHIPGAGDFEINAMTFLPDPCPLPDSQKQRRLDAKEKLIYAPFSSINNVLFDKDAIYINTGTSHHSKNLMEKTNSFYENNESKQETDLSKHKLDAADNMFIDGIMGIKYSLSEKLNAAKLDLIPDCEIQQESLSVVSNSSVDKTDSENSEIFELNSKSSDGTSENVNGGYETRINNKTIHKHDFMNGIDEERIRKTHLNIQESPNIILQNLIYMKSFKEETNNEQSFSQELVGDLFFEKATDLKKFSSKKTIGKNYNICNFDCSRTSNKYDVNELIDNNIDWNDEMNKNLVKSCFLVSNQIKRMNHVDNSESGSDVYGDFEILEESQIDENLSKNNNGLLCEHSSSDEFDGYSDINDDSSNELSFESDSKKHKMNSPLKINNENNKNSFDEKIKKKLDFDKKFDDSSKSHKIRLDDLNGPDNTLDEMEVTKRDSEEKYLKNLKLEALRQSTLNNDEFKDMSLEQRVLYQGFSPGLYVRIELNDISHELVEYFDPKYPLVVGGLLPNEDQFGYLNFRIKKHKWYKRILKNRDPIIVSNGWRRFQTIVLFSAQDHNKRQRSIKYTPAHIHCYATCYGPKNHAGTGMLALQVPPIRSKRDFKITATGVNMEVDQSVSIVKKLKLIGTPLKIFKNTAFIRGMFSNSLEVTKFEGSVLTTVSGIRGHIKKASTENNGDFRATFEDRILMSDVVFLRTWIPLECPQFFFGVNNLMLPNGERENWHGMKTTGTLKYEQNIPIENNPDSQYTPIERLPRIFAPITIPPKLQKTLPFKSKPKTIIKDANLSAITLMKEILLTNKELTVKRSRKRKANLEAINKKLEEAEKKRQLKIKSNRRSRYNNVHR